MRLAAGRSIGFACVAITLVIQGRAEQRQASGGRPDPRVGLKAGLRDAGEAARNMERVASLSKPEGFFDPKAPGGTPTPPERDPKAPESNPDGSAAEPTAT